MQKHKLWQFLKTLCIRFFEDQCPTRAASLAFTTLLSVVPLIIFIFYMLSFFPDLQQSGKEIEQFILNNFVASSANTIAHHLQIFTDNIHALSWINISALAFISILLIFNIIGSLNDIWHVSLKKDFGLSFFVNVIILFIAPIIFGFLLLFSAFLMSLPLLSRIVDVQFIAKPTMLIFPLLIEWVTFTLFHWIMPSCHVKFRPAVIAGLITMVLFEMAKWGFVQYLHYFPTYQLVYGALATIPIFFVWIYVCWLIVIVGALICALLSDSHLRSQATP